MHRAILFAALLIPVNFVSMEVKAQNRRAYNQWFAPRYMQRPPSPIAHPFYGAFGSYYGKRLAGPAG